METVKHHIRCLTILLFSTLTAISQQNSTDSIYKHLDVFLENPSSQNSTTLALFLEKSTTTKKEVLLAKAVAYCNLGYVEAEKNNYQSAIGFYEKAKQLYFFENLNGYDIIEYCLKPLGNLYVKTQAFSEAENTIKHYIVIAQETKQLNQEVSGIVNLSILYHNRGEFNKAGLILKQGLQIAPNNTALKLNLATNYFGMGNYNLIKPLLNEVLAKAPKNPQAYQLLAQLYLSEKEYNKAISALKVALTVFENSPKGNKRALAKTYLTLADTYYVTNDIQKSIATIQKTYSLLLPSYTKTQQFPYKKQLYADTALLDALDLQATAFTTLGETDKAIECFEMAAEVCDYLAIQLYSQESKLIIQQQVKFRAEHLLDLYFEKYQKTKHPQWIERALQLESTIKGRVVLDAINYKNKLNKAENGTFKLFNKQQNNLAVLHSQILEITSRQEIDYEKLKTLQKQYSNVLTRQRILYDSTRRSVSTLKKQFFLTEIKTKAAELNQTVVSYFVGGQTVYQFIISAENTAFVKLTNSKETYEKFIENIAAYNRFFNAAETINNDISLFKKTAYTLLEQLNIPKAKKLLIIPDGILSFVPFQTLITKETETLMYEKMPFLVFESEVSNAVSLLEYLKNDTPFINGQTVLGIFPGFKNTPQELEYSGLEAKTIAALFPTKLLIEKQANTTAFRESTSSYSILHIATHALGGTFTSEPSILFSDSTLSIESIYGLHLSNQLVVLSACDTGIGKVVKGEGVQSLARAFQYAGAPNILFSLWQVNDKSTAFWMGYYYENLKKTKSRNYSQQQASLQYLTNENIDNSRKSPYYWGAFVYYGAIDIPQPSFGVHWYLAGLVFLLILGILSWIYFIRK